MTDTHPQGTTATLPTPAATAAPKPVRDEKNGITRPAPDTVIGKVWKTADDLSATLRRPATRAEVRDAIGDSVNPATVATQYARWTKFHGAAEIIKGHRKAETAKRQEEANAAKTAKAAEKEAAKAAKAGEDEAKAKAAADKEAAKAAKEAEKVAKAKAAEDAKATKLAEKEAAAKAKADEKAAAKAAKDAEKAAAAQAKQAAAAQPVAA